MSIYICSNCKFPNELSKRSNQANKYFHVALHILGEHLGYTLDEMKTLMKYHFGYYKEMTDKNTGETVIHYEETSKMDSVKFGKLIEQVVKFAAEQGVSIESPEEYYSKT